METISLYVHIPFCTSRCPYCHFVSMAGANDQIPAYLAALKQEIRWWADYYQDSVALKSIYFGGGTPSNLSREHVKDILKTIKSGYILKPGIEITLEANPEQHHLEYYQSLRDSGINRISLGMQTAVESELKFLQRHHSSNDLEIAVSNIRSAGISNISLDLMFGLPGQTIQTWQQSLEKTISLNPVHLSLYDLEISPGTKLFDWVEAGHVVDMDSDERAGMYEAAQKFLDSQNFIHYEISNWCKPGYESRHNMNYWSGKKYIGAGLGAHGFTEDLRIANKAGLEDYIVASQASVDENSPEFPFANEILAISDKDKQQEFMFLGLRRLKRGVSDNDFQKRFGKTIGEVFGKEITKLIHLRLIDQQRDGDDQILKLSQKGVLLANRVFQEFVN